MPIRFDPIQTMANRRTHLFWDNIFPEPVKLCPAENIAISHTGHTTESLCAALTQAIASANAADPGEDLDQAALAYACAHYDDPHHAARALGMTLAEFERRVKTLNKHNRNQVRLEAARAYASASESGKSRWR